MQSNLNTNYPNQCYPQANPNAVNINIYSPQAYGAGNNNACCDNQNGYYSMYGNNTMPNLPLYPQNYNVPINYNYANNPIAQPNYNQAPQDNQSDNKLNPTNQLNMFDDKNTSSNQSSDTVSETGEIKKSDKKEKEKTIVPLSDDYIKNLENYLNSSNSKIRLVGMKELMERFKEKEDRKDNKSLIPLLNKALQDTSPTVRFLALTTLQLGYSVGDDKTVQLLTKIANENQDKFGQDAILASEILLKLSAPAPIKVKEGENK